MLGVLLTAGAGAATPAGTAAATAAAPEFRGEILVNDGSGEAWRLTRIDPERNPIRIDGRLDEPVWRSIAAQAGFRVLIPDTLREPAHETYLRLAYDDKGLYVAADMHQPEETLIARLSGRDIYMSSRDGMGITLDTSGEGRYGFWFSVNLGDSVSDGTVLPERKYSRDWDGPWRGRSQTTDTGWTAELFIPWSTVSMPAAGEVRHMGVYVSRTVAYRKERWGWPALPETQPRFMSSLQQFEMSDVAPRQQYNIYPYVSAGRDWMEPENRVRAGGDLFWRPSSNFQLLATINPDFGNVESDDVVVNLSATETFFPEKRLFFLEGQEVFIATPRADTRRRGVGNTGAPYTMLNTRRIGGQPREPLVDSGQEVLERNLIQPTELYGAAKTTGQLGNFRYGVLSAFEKDAKFYVVEDDDTSRIQQNGNNYGVARLLYETNHGGGYRALGFLSTATLNPDRDAYAAGVDWHYFTPSGKLKIDGQLMTSDIEDELSEVDDLGRGYGGFVDFEYTYRQGVVQRVGLEYFDEQFDINDLGFLARNDEYRIRSSFSVTTSDHSWARDNQFDVRGFLQNNVSHNRFTGGGIFFSDRATFDDLTSITVRLNHFFPIYDDLNSFDNGTFRIEERTDFRLKWQSDTTRKFSFGFGGGIKDEDLGGDTYIGEANFNWRPDDRFNLTLGIVYQNREDWLLHIDNDDGIRNDRLMVTYDAEQWQPKLSIDYFLSARQQFRVSMQWVGIKAQEDDFYLIPDRAGNLIPIDKPTGPGARPSYDFSVSQYSFQARYRWEIAPLSDIFVVYTRQADLGAALGDDSFSDVFRNSWKEPLTNFLIFKIRYRLGS